MPRTISVTITITMIFILLQALSNYAATSAQRQPLEGRVEMIESGVQPELPSDLPARLSGGIEQSRGSLPEAFQGKWYGQVRITQLETYPDQHQREPYCLQFIEEIGKFFQRGLPGKLALDILATAPEGVLRLATSDIHFSGGAKVQLTTHRGRALVPGGFNIPTVVKDDVTQFSADRVEQTRVDQVAIVDAYNHLIQRGYTEVSALYHLQAPKRMYVKLLNIDYDERGKPLWKVLIEGKIYR